MCLKIGVDPLACKFQTFSPFEASKGFWAKLLGVGDFYYELSVQIIEVCLKTKDRVRFNANNSKVLVSSIHSKMLIFVFA
jgi:hypothetical protein